MGFFKFKCHSSHLTIEKSVIVYVINTLFQTHLKISRSQLQVNPKINHDTLTMFLAEALKNMRTSKWWLVTCQTVQATNPKPQQRINSSWLVAKGPVLLNGQHTCQAQSKILCFPQTRHWEVLYLYKCIFLLLMYIDICKYIYASKAWVCLTQITDLQWLLC